MVTGYCWDCSKALRKGEGKFEVRKGTTTEKRRMVCRDRAECDYRRSLWKAQEQARINADSAALDERIQAMGDDEWRAVLLTVPTAGEW